MMRHTVFYSWQTDLPSAINRSLIEEALTRALKGIKKGKAPFLDPVLDRDTAGLAGSPDIAETIFGKIATADVFVADVSIINPTSRLRRTPNPNVLVELGYAVATLGWNRILLVQNTAFGQPDKLPFDLRGRRVIPYHHPLRGGSKAEQRGLLQGRLESALRSALADITPREIFAGPDVPLWFGTWEIDSRGATHGGKLRITEIGPSGFLFHVTVFNGSHMGEVSGFARILTPDSAVATLPTREDAEPCQISFKRSVDKGRRTIRLDESGLCSFYHGMGTAFFGTFIREPDRLFDAGILDELDLVRLRRITGRFYDALRLRFQGLSQADNVDSFPGKATVGGVRGLYTAMEGILLRGEDGELWAAFIDDDDVVRYFTTVPSLRNSLPKTFEAWRERFREKRVIYDSDIFEPSPNSDHPDAPNH